MPDSIIRYRDIRRSAIEAEISGLKAVVIKVGVQGPSATESKTMRVAPSSAKAGAKGKRRSRVVPGKLRVVDIATIHEFGAPKARIPERSFLRSAVRDNKAKIQGFQRRAYRAALHGDAASTVVHRLALFAENAVKRQIVELRDPPLAASTKARRKRMTGDVDPNPLIDTGQMKNSITSVVEGM